MTDSRSSIALSRSACDTCRRRKVRCTGDQPCERCVKGGILCTFGNAAGRVTAADYARQLEIKIAELQAMLQAQTSPEVGEDLSSYQSAARDNLIDTLVKPDHDYVHVIPISSTKAYYGRFSGLSILRTVRDLCSTDDAFPRPETERPGRDIAEAFDCATIDIQDRSHIAGFVLLPSRESLLATIDIALDYALSIRNCIDRSDLAPKIQRLFSLDPEDYTPEDKSFLALIYALMALGRRYAQDDEDEEAIFGSNDTAIVRGSSYFRASRAILESTACCNLDTVRTYICLINFLLSSSMMSNAYQYVCAGAGVALRLGLHVSSLPGDDSFTPQQLSQRRQVFAVLNMVDIIVSSTLGMPNILRDAEVDQCIAVPEGELADLGRTICRENPHSPVCETILATKLFQIEAQILNSRFPSSKPTPSPAGVYELGHDEISRFEVKLRAWHDLLPEMLQLGDPRALRSQLLLRFAYATTEMALYRPFLNHVLRDSRDADFTYQGFTYSSACIRASMQAVWLVDEMNKHHFLHEADWFLIYALAGAASILFYFVINNKEGPTVEESSDAALRALQLLKKLAKKNISAQRCYKSLEALPESLPLSEPNVQALSPRSRFMEALGLSDTGLEV